MVYNSLAFIGFIGVILIFYYAVCPRKQNMVLAIANVVFYALCGIGYAVFMLLSIVIVYAVSNQIQKIYDVGEQQLNMAADIQQKKSIKQLIKQKARTWVILGLIFILGSLIFCKYFNFLISNLNYILAYVQVSFQFNIFNKFLPIGISFYSFMVLGYLLDIYWKRYSAEKNIIRLVAFALYFPHIVQGPIARYNRMNGYLAKRRTFEVKKLTDGIELMIWGFIKKMVIADRIGIFVSTVYDNWIDYKGFIFIIATALYSIQIYADFSGCIDIVRGASEMFGIHLDDNFKQPYFAKTMPEFWRRWHMSLNTWFKDYLYYPVSTSKFVKKYSKKIKQKYSAAAGKMFISVFSAAVVWLATGIWHGAQWKYLLWGIYHASLIIAGILFETPLQRAAKALEIDISTYSWKLFQMLRTFSLCCIGRVFFRADDVFAAFGIFNRTFMKFDPWIVATGNLYSYGLDRSNFILMLVLIGILFCVDMMKEKIRIRESLARQNIVFRWSVLYLAIFTVVIFGIYGPGYDASSFIYNQF